MIYYYDYSLVVLSVFLAIMASFASLSLGSRIDLIEGRKIYLWITGGAFAMGFGIWSMHFVGMLAFHLSVELVYDTGLTLASVFIAVISSGVALLLIKFFRRTKKVLYAASVLFGLGISAMHYTGMAAIPILPPIRYNVTFVTLSVVIAIVTSFFALRFVFEKNTSGTIFHKNNFIAALMMGFAIAGMHYTAMQAAYFSDNSICTIRDNALNSEFMALVITLLTVFILTLTIIPLAFEVKLSEKKAFLVDHLQKHNNDLEKKAEAMALSMTKAFREMAERDRTLATIIEQTNEAIVTVDKENKITSWNNAAHKIYGYREKEVLGKDLDTIIVTCKDEQLPDLPGEKEFEILEIVTHRRKNGTPVYVTINETPRYDDNRKFNGKILIIRDVSGFHQSQRQLILWGAAFRNSNDGILITDRENRIISANHSFFVITGYREEEVLGKKPSILSSGRHDSEFYRKMWENLEKNESWNGEIWNKTKSGEVFPERLSIKAIKNEKGEVLNYVAIFRDIATEKKKEEEIHQLAYYDQLTSLPNRTLMHDRLQQALSHANRVGKKVGIMFLDLDRFKNVNDMLGHVAGDVLLIETAVRLKKCIRADDTLCRQGGDEFILILQEINSGDDLAMVAEKLIESISQDYQIDHESVSITTSIGVSVYPDDGIDSEELIKRADMAMYAAKSGGRNQYQFYTAEMNRQVHEKMQIEKELARAIRENTLDIVFQPQIYMQNGELFGAEALLRWNHPELGAIPPSKFITIAEETGLIIELDKWMIGEIVKRIVQWKKELKKFPKLRFSCNLSGAEIDNESFLINVASLLKKSKIPANTLEFEITETTLMRDMVHTHDVLSRLNNMGILVAIDDFGTGYSSLSYLKTLPIDTLKIDRSFIVNIENDENERKITEAIINLAHTLEIEVIAEGVETLGQTALLTEYGCKIAQGYYYHQPLSEKEFLNLLTSQVVA